MLVHAVGKLLPAPWVVASMVSGVGASMTRVCISAVAQPTLTAPPVLLELVDELLLAPPVLLDDAVVDELLETVA
jgi:hypothetical protein